MIHSVSQPPLLILLNNIFYIGNKEYLLIEEQYTPLDNRIFHPSASCTESAQLHFLNPTFEPITLGTTLNQTDSHSLKTLRHTNIMMFSKATLGSFAALTCVAGIASAQYTLQDTFDTSNFFDSFSFFTGSDPTNGFVDYVGTQTANETSLAGYANNAVYLGVDYTTMNPSGGRASVRMTSNAAYTHGLFVLDVAHMPGGICGVWPAFWTFGPNWPSSGEIDIIEGVNDQSTNEVTLHTSSGCTMSNAGSASGSTLANANCNAGNGNDGCSQSTASTQGYGTGFNDIGGGVYAMDWTSSAISIYFFPRGSIPSDITSGNPNPSGWGAPQAMFSGPSCDIDAYFMNHNIVFDTTFCGDWAGSVWSSDATCSALASTCQDYVANNPGDFVDAYWLINSLKVYQQSGSSKRGFVPQPFLA